MSHRNHTSTGLRILIAGAALLAPTVAAADSDMMGVSEGALFRISRIDASVSLIGSGPGTTVSALAYRDSDGLLYGFVGSFPSRIITIDPATGAQTLGPQLPFTVAEGGLAIAPDGRAFGVGVVQTAFRPQLFEVNLDTGAASIIGVVSGGDRDINGLEWRSDGQLIGLDRFSNGLLVIDPQTAQASFLEAIPGAVGAVGGLAAVGNTYYAATAGAGAVEPGSNSLYRFDAFTGGVELVGSFGTSLPSSGLWGLAFVPEPGTPAAAACVGLLLLAYRPRCRGSAS